MHHTPVCTSLTKRVLDQFSLTPSVPAQTVNISKVFLSEADLCSSPFPSSFRKGQCPSTEALKDIFKVNFYFTPQATVCNCSSLLPERNFLAAEPFARQTSLAVQNTGNVMGHGGGRNSAAVIAEIGGWCEDC